MTARGLSWLLFLPATLAVFAVQSTLSPVGGTQIPIALPIAAALSAAFGAWGVVAAAAWGLVGDALATGALGPGVIGFAVSASVFSRFGLRGMLWMILLLSVLCGVEMAAEGACREWLAGRVPQWGDVGTLAVVGAGLSLPSAAVAAVVARRLGGWRSTGPAGETLDVRNDWRMLTN